MRPSRALAAPAAVLVAWGCARAAGSSTRLTVTGSSTIAPLMAEIARRYEAARPGVRVDVQAGGSSRGVSDVRAELGDVGMVSRALHPDEADLEGTLIARDGVCLIVHRDNPVAELSEAQVLEVFTGRARNWTQVGGRDAPITVVNKAEGRSTLELFLRHFKLKNSDVRADVVIGDNAQGIKTVAGNPGAIGYVSIGTAEYDAGRGLPIRALAMEGVPADTESVRSGRFPLVRPLTLVTRRPPSPAAAALVAFARSPEVADLVREYQFVPR